MAARPLALAARASSGDRVVIDGILAAAAARNWKRGSRVRPPRYTVPPPDIARSTGLGSDISALRMNFWTAGSAIRALSYGVAMRSGAGQGGQAAQDHPDGEVGGAVHVDRPALQHL